MRWEELDKQFEIQIPPDVPVYPVNVVCELLHMQYYLLHEIMQQGILEERRRRKQKKLFSQQDIRKLKYIKYLIEERGVNVKGVKVILEIQER